MVVKIVIESIIIIVVIVIEFELKDNLPFENKSKKVILIVNTIFSLLNKDTRSVY